MEKKCKFSFLKRNISNQINDLMKEKTDSLLGNSNHHKGTQQTEKSQKSFK